MQDNHEWNAPSPEQEQIIALTAKFEKLEKATKDKNKKTGKPAAKPTGKAKGDKPALADWQLVPPGPGEPLTKEINGKTFHWW